MRLPVAGAGNAPPAVKPAAEPAVVTDATKFVLALYVPALIRLPLITVIGKNDSDVKI